MPVALSNRTAAVQPAKLAAALIRTVAAQPVHMVPLRAVASILMAAQGARAFLQRKQDVLPTRMAAVRTEHM